MDAFKMGTDVHALMPGGECAFGLVIRWDMARQVANVVVFSSRPDGDSLTSLVRELPHREQPGPTDELTFHMAAHCPWNR